MMKASTSVLLTLIGVFCVATLVGCSGGGSTQDNGPPSRPPLTAAETKAAISNVNSGAGADFKKHAVK